MSNGGNKVREAEDIRRANCRQLSGQNTRHKIQWGYDGHVPELNRSVRLDAGRKRGLWLALRIPHEGQYVSLCDHIRPTDR